MTLLFHRDLGGEGKPPLLILHGFLGSSRNWQLAGRDLAADFHVLALDLRNHGASPHFAEQTFAGMTEDLLRWMDAHRLERAHLLGHSLGGKLVMRAACRHPERAASVIVVDIAPREYAAGRHRAEIDAMSRLDLAEHGSRRAAEEALAAAIPDEAKRKFLLMNLERRPDGSLHWSINLPVLGRYLAETGENSLDASDRYAGPALFIVGGRSNFVSEDDHEAIRRHFPRAKIQILAQSGHNPHVEARDCLIEAVRAHAHSG